MSASVTAPPWAGSAAAPACPPLQEDARAAVCVVGGGLAGLLTALLLARRGVPVLVLERGAVGGGESGRTTAHLTTALDGGYRALARRRGAALARLAAESHSAGLELVSSLCAEHRIACDLETVDGFVVGRPGRERELDEELAAVRAAGLIEVERLERVPGEAFGPAGCLRYPRQAQLDPARLLAGLARAVERFGGRLHAGTRVVAIESGGGEVLVRAESGRVVRAGAAVVAAHDVPGGMPPAGQPAPRRTYVLAAPVPPRSVPRALYWETGRPYHYVRVFGSSGLPWAPEPGEFLVVGGEDHATGRPASPDGRFRRLEGWMRERFPMAQGVTHRWSGQILEAPDGLAAIGRDPRRPRVFVATGFGGNGVTHAAVAAMLLEDLVEGRPNPWEAVYEPSRLGRGRALRLAGEGLRRARGLSSWLAPAEEEAARGLAPGAGAVVRRGLRRAALYRDAAGRLHRFSAACRHLGCIVRFNEAERSWDCPCHGSRYDGFGRVLNGPAVEGLKPLDEGEERRP